MRTRRDSFIRFSNFAIDSILRIEKGEVLNTGAIEDRPQNPAEEMMKVSKQLLASSLDTKSGKINYGALRDSEIYARFRRISRSLKTWSLEQSKAGDFATSFWINIYNALIIDGIIHYQLSGSMLGQPSFFRRIAYDIGGMRFSADAIEHEVLCNNRPNPALPIPIFTSDDPRNHVYQPKLDARIHFTMVCGANSCPSISFYNADKLQEQLDLAAGAFINGSGVRFDQGKNTLWLSRIFKWYQEDFGGQEGVLDIVRSYLKDSNLVETIASGQFRLRYMPYDWSVNRIG
jgi:hypothetical protein